MKPFVPHAYQETAIQFLVENPHAGLFLAPGLGKTSITLAAFKVLRKVGFVKTMLVITPLRPCYSVWPNEVLKWDDFNGLSVGILHGPKKLKTLNTKHDVFVINPEGLRWLFTTLRSNMPFDMLVVDECFVAGTKIATETGEVSIEDVRVGDRVLTPFGFKRVSRTMQRKTRTLNTLSLEDRVIISTPEHPVFTKKGWVCANGAEKSEVLDICGVSNLWEDVRGASDRFGSGTSRDLFEILFSEYDVENSPGAARTGICEDDGYTDWSASLECWKRVVRGSEAETARRGSEEQSARKVSEDSRGERNRAISGRSPSSTVSSPHVHLELPNSVGREARRLSYKLQGGLRGSCEEGSDRSGWRIAQQPGAAPTGPEEGGEAVRAGVDSSTDSEPGCLQDVWNLEVEGCPFYFANGVLVHNCSRFKHINTDRFKTLKPHLPKFKRRVILTGSPAPNSLLDLFGQMYVLDLGKTLSPYITHFRSKFFDKRTFEVRHPNPEKAALGLTLKINDWYVTPEKAENLYDHIAPHVLRMSAEDYLTMPELIFNDIYIDLPKEARAMYKQFEDALRLDFKKGRVTAANAAIKGMKCRQIANGGIYLDEDGSAHRKWRNLHDAKAEVVAELVEELEGSPALIAYEFQHDLERLKKALGKDTPHIGGGVPMKVTQEIIKGWNDFRYPALLGQPQSMAHGLNLQESGDTVIWHSLVFNFEDYDQFIKRVYRQGKKKPVTVHRIIARDTVDEIVASALSRKEANQESLFDAIKSYWS